MKVVDVDGAVDVARVRFQGRALSDAAGRRYRVQQIGGHHPPPIVELGEGHLILGVTRPQIPPRETDGRQPELLD